MEKETDSNMATPIILPTLLSMNGKQRSLVSFAVQIVHFQINLINNFMTGREEVCVFVAVNVTTKYCWTKAISTNQNVCTVIITFWNEVVTYFPPKEV